MLNVEYDLKLQAVVFQRVKSDPKSSKNDDDKKKIEVIKLYNGPSRASILLHEIEVFLEFHSVQCVLNFGPQHSYKMMRIPRIPTNPFSIILRKLSTLFEGMQTATRVCLRIPSLAVRIPSASPQGRTLAIRTMVWC